MRWRTIGCLVLMAAVCGCSKEQVTSNTSNAANKVADATRNAVSNVQEVFDVSGDRDERPDPKAIERERFDQKWRQLQSLRESQARAAAAQQQLQKQQQAAANAPKMPAIVREAKFSEKLKGTPFDTIDTLPVHLPITGDVNGPSILKTQVLLDRANYSVGVIDGRWGKNAAISVYWFQQEHGIEPTGDVDEATFRALFSAAAGAPALVRYTVTADDVKGPFTQIPDDVYEQEKLDCLCYESPREELAEKFHVAEDFLDMLNPTVEWKSLQAGQTILVPNVRPPRTAEQVDVAKIVISVRGNYMNAFDASGNLLFHAPTTLGSKYDPSPSETLKIVGISHDPNFHYQPKLFHEVPDSDPEAHLNPGPNGPVGVVWMALSKEHYGIHGTAFPDSIGYASSHGCVRLTNWDARDLSYRVQKGTVVSFVDTRGSDSASSDSDSGSSRK